MKWDAGRGVYRCRRQVNKREYRASFRRKPDAEEWERNMDRRTAGLDPLPRIVTLQEAWDLYKAGLREAGSPETTLRYYRVKYARLEEHLSGGTVLNRLTHVDVQDYILARRRARRPAGNRTLRAELALLYRMTVRAGEAHECEIVPAWRMPRLRVVERHRQVPEPEEMARLWHELHGPAQVAVGLCLFTGMRASEAMRAHTRDLSLRDKVLLLRERKTNDEHVVPIVDTLAVLLPSSGPLVAATEAAVRSALVRASARAGTRTWSGPGLGRATFSTWAVRYGGFTQEQVADALGHRTPGSATPGYIRAQAVEPVRRPMARLVERVLLEAVAGLQPEARSAEIPATISAALSSTPNDTRVRKPPGSILYLLAQLLKPLD